MAQCPQCADSTLVHAMLAENLAAYSCGKCLGTLVSLVAYRAWRENTAPDPLEVAPGAVADAADTVGAKKCPKCSSLMSKYRITAEKANRLDFCPHCEEVWLDEGEWRLIESLALCGDLTRVFSQAWQNIVHSDVASAMEAGRLRTLLGDDLHRVEQFRAWLLAHPHRGAILAMLARRK